jgi:uncharacterized protein YjdB
MKILFFPLNAVRMTITALLALMLTFAACGGGGGNNSVTGVTLNKTSLTLREGAQETLIATVLPTNASNKSVNWTSSDEAFATVTNTGLVEAIAQGSSTITVTTVDGNKTATCQVTVNQADAPIISVNVTPKNPTIEVGNTQQFKATVTGTTNTAVTWTATNGSITATGLCTAPGESGTYTVTATSVADSTKSDTTTVTVNPTTTDIAVSVLPQNPTVTVGGTQQFAATVTGTTNTAVTWTVLTADGGSINASGLYTAPNTEGTYTIRATSVADATNGRASCREGERTGA